MAGKTGVSINWGGFKEMVEKATSGISNTQRLMTHIGMAMKAGTVRRFSEGVDPEGKAWEPSKKTIKTESPAKKAKGKKKVAAKKKAHGKTLVDTAHLKKSISFNASPFAVFVGSVLPYARIHQLGGKAGRGRKVTIPARPYLGISKDDKAEIQALIAAHIEGVFK